jgi:hypothetical protein
VTKAPKPQPDAGRLLSLVADALTQCEAGGIAVRFKHGAIFTRVGYVLQIGEKTWAARTLDYTAFPVPAGDDED